MEPEHAKHGLTTKATKHGVGVTQKGEKTWFMSLIGSNLYPRISNSCLYESRFHVMGSLGLLPEYSGSYVPGMAHGKWLYDTRIFSLG
jgi:hypothetical protein